MSLTIHKLNDIYVDNILPIGKDAAAITLIWAIFSRVFDLDPIFPSIVFLIVLPICIYGFFKSRQSIAITDKTLVLNNAANQVITFINRKTQSGSPRLCAARFIKYLLKNDLQRSSFFDNKLTLQFYETEYRFSQKDNSWLIIPALVVLRISNKGIFEFEKGKEPYEMKYSYVLFREKYVWKNIYPGSSDTFTIDVERSQGWIKVSSKGIKDIHQKNYKDIL